MPRKREPVPQNVKEVISDLTTELIKANYTVEFINKMKLEGNCGGECCDYDKYVKIAVGRPFKIWVPIFIHEYNHFRQAQLPSLKRFNKAIQEFFVWLDNKDYELSERMLHKYVRGSMECEWDCEKRTVKLIQDRGLPFDTKDYIKGANAYVYMYVLCKKYRKWCDKQSPYKIKRIVKMMPDEFLPNIDDYFDVPPEYEKLILKYCFK